MILLMLGFPNQMFMELNYKYISQEFCSSTEHQQAQAVCLR